MLKKKDGRVKDNLKVECKDFGNTPFGKYFSYRHEQNGNILDISLPCSIPSYRFGGFSKTFDDYSDEFKNCLLTSKYKHTTLIKLNFGWVDWSYSIKKKLVWKKRIIKRTTTTRFARMQQSDEYPSLQRNS